MTKTSMTTMAMVTARALSAAAVMCLGTPAQAQEPASVAGPWLVTIDSRGAHQDMKASLVLQQDGARLSGTFSTPHAGDLPIEGEMAGGKVSFAVKTPDGGQTLGFTATLRDSDTMEGFMSTPTGDLKWTATRDKARK